jgi:hypothetical protein
MLGRRLIALRHRERPVRVIDRRTAQRPAVAATHGGLAGAADLIESVCHCNQLHVDFERPHAKYGVKGIYSYSFLTSLWIQVVRSS